MLHFIHEFLDTEYTPLTPIPLVDLFAIQGTCNEASALESRLVHEALSGHGSAVLPDELLAKVGGVLLDMNDGVAPVEELRPDTCPMQ